MELSAYHIKAVALQAVMSVANDHRFADIAFDRMFESIKIVFKKKEKYQRKNFKTEQTLTNTGCVMYYGVDDLLGAPTQHRRAVR